jgi:hypothetical protein
MESNEENFTLIERYIMNKLMSTTKRIEVNMKERLNLWNEKLELKVLEVVLDELMITDNTTYDDTMDDDVADVYQEVLEQRADAAEDLRELL